MYFKKKLSLCPKLGREMVDSHSVANPEVYFSPILLPRQAYPQHYLTHRWSRNVIIILTDVTHWRVETTHDTRKPFHTHGSMRPLTLRITGLMKGMENPTQGNGK